MAGYVISGLVGLLCISLCQGLYFHIGETEQKCFIEEVPSETMIVGECVHRNWVMEDVCE